MSENVDKILEKRRHLKEIYSKVFSSPEGSEVLADLGNRCFVGKPSYNPNLTDSVNRAIFNEGRRAIYLHIVGTMNLDLEGFEKQLKKQEE